MDLQCVYPNNASVLPLDSIMDVSLQTYRYILLALNVNSFQTVEPLMTCCLDALEIIILSNK